MRGTKARQLRKAAARSDRDYKELKKLWKKGKLKVYQFRGVDGNVVYGVAF